MPKKGDSNASTVIFGFVYQIDAAIYLFLRKIKEISKIKVEGRCEDVEIVYEDKSKSFCQIKSVYNPLNTSSNTQKLRKAMEQLSTHELGVNDDLIYCSNQKDLIFEKSKLFESNCILEYSYSYLEDEYKKKIEKYFKNGSKKNLDKLYLIKVPYEVSLDSNTRRNHIMRKLESFLIKVNVKVSYAESVFDKWHNFLMSSSLANKDSFFLDKKQLVWIIIIEILNQRITDEDLAGEDETLLEDVKKAYEDIISTAIFYDFEVTNQIIGKYKSNKYNLKNFINDNLTEFCNLIYPNKSFNELGEVNKMTVKIIVKIILISRLNIESVKEGVGIK